MDGSVFRQVQSPDSIVQNLPDNSPRLRSQRNLSVMLPASRGTPHQPTVFMNTSSVSLTEEYRVPSLPSEPLPRHLTRRQQPSMSTRPTPQQRASHEPQNEGLSPKDILAKTMAKVWFERNAEKAHATLKSAQMAARMKELRKQLDYIDDTEWYYTPIDELIGQY